MPCVLSGDSPCRETRNNPERGSYMCGDAMPPAESPNAPTPRMGCVGAGVGRAVRPRIAGRRVWCVVVVVARRARVWLAPRGPHRDRNPPRPHPPAQRPAPRGAGPPRPLPGPGPSPPDQAPPAGAGRSGGEEGSAAGNQPTGESG